MNSDPNAASPSSPPSQPRTADSGLPLRTEGVSKVTGQARYVDDLPLDVAGSAKDRGLLHGVTVRSQVPRGRLRAIEFQPGVPWSEFTVVTAADIPDSGHNSIALIEYDQPCLVSTLVGHSEEAVVLLAHPDRELCEKARGLVRLDIEPLPAIFDVDDSLHRGSAGGEIIWGTDNTFKTVTIEKGDAEAGLREAEVIVEGEYETGAQEQLYIEPQGMMAWRTDDGGIAVCGSLQCPYYIHKALMHLFGLPPEKVRVVQAETGGGFGGKEEYPSMIAAHAALLSWKSGCVVKIIYDRLEDMVATTKRHPSRTRIRTGWTRDGKLVAQDIDFRLDGGAYMTLSPVVLSRGGLHAAGPYSCPNVMVRARAAATSTSPHGAFRGFGAPQTVFAMERHLDEVAKRLGILPEELRRKNLVRDGETLSTTQVVRDHVDLRALLDRAMSLSRYTDRRSEHAAYNAEQERTGGHKRRGIGLASFMHGAGFTGSGERMLSSVVSVDADAAGMVYVRASSTEIGQGTNTVFSKLASDALGVPMSAIHIVRPDTAAVPNSGPTVASRTVMVVGRLVEKACQALREKLTKAGLLGETYSAADFQTACRRYHETLGALGANSEYQQPSGIEWDDKRYRGDAYATYAWAVYVADVEVDLVTYETAVRDFWAVQEIGRVVHPILAAGQIEGGVAQGIGFALYEKVVYREGRMANGQMTNYIMPTSMDVPDIHVDFLAVPTPHGPGGAKGIGELPLDGSAPAVINAVAQATGLPLRKIPMTPEDLMRATLVEGMEARL